MLEFYGFNCKIIYGNLVHSVGYCVINKLKTFAHYTSPLSHSVNEILTSISFTDNNIFSINLPLFPGCVAIQASQFDTDVKLKTMFSLFLRILMYRGHSFTFFDSQ